MNTTIRANDSETAAAFASSWNTVRKGSVYTREQFLDWIAPLNPEDDIRGKDVLELGFGNGSLLFHTANCVPKRLVGVELGDTFEVARENLASAPVQPELVSGDLCDIDVGTFDLVYCIGVLHHLKDPSQGFRSVLAHTRPGGRFHCWVYGHEGNALVRMIVEPVRRVASHLPWWFTKYCLALPLVVPYFVYAKSVAALIAGPSFLSQNARRLPLAEYSTWISARPFWFFHHVAFDQLVTPQTQYLKREAVEAMLSDPRIDPASVYVIARNGNSWKFGGRARQDGKS